MNAEMNASIKEIKNNPDFIDVREDMIDCYKLYKNQEHFNFYIQELNHHVQITGYCCSNMMDSYCYHYYTFPKLYPYLNERYKERIK